MSKTIKMKQKMDLLVRARVKQGWAQADLAEHIGVASKTIARWEAGISVPHPVYRAKLRTLLHIDPEEIWPVQASFSTPIGTENQAGTLHAEEATRSFTFPPIWNVPFARNPFFIGRENFLEQLHLRFHASQTVALSQPQAISGLGGIGKTQLALEYAYRYHQDYKAILWVRAESAEALVSSYVSIATLLQLPESEAKTQEIAVQSVKTWLQSRSNWLLILDNVDDLTLLPGFLPPIWSGHLLLTTRTTATGQLAFRLEIETLSPVQGALFLLRRAAHIEPLASFEQASLEERELAIQIAQELGGLPLALDQVGAYLEETGTDLSGYWQVYQQHRTDLLQKRGRLINDHPAPVATTWSLSFQQVQKQQPAAAELLHLCAFFSPDMIPEEVLTTWASLLGANLASVTADIFLLDQAVEALRAYSLIRRNSTEKTFSIHRLVQAVVQDRLSKPEKRIWAERAMFVINAAFPHVEHSIWSLCERLLSQALTAARLIEQNQFIGEEAGRLLHETAAYLQERARYVEAEPLYHRALYIREQHLGAQHPDVAASLTGLARLYRRQGKYAEAEPLYQRALHIREQHLGAQHPDVATSLTGLAHLYRRQEKYVEAEPLYQRALHIREQHLGSQHPDVATSLTGLADLFYDQGKYAEAEPLYQRALHIREQHLGSQHPDVAHPLNNLARLYFEQGKYAEAEVLFQRALRIYEQQLGSQHPWVAYPLHGLANLYFEQGKYAEAEVLFQQALHIRSQQLGSLHPRTAEIMHDLAKFREAQGDHEGAKMWYTQTLRVREQVLGTYHPKTIVTRNHFITLLHTIGQYEKAILDEGSSN